MEEKKVSYDLALEAAEARHERTVKRFILAIIIIMILFFANNAAWLYAWIQYDYGFEETEETVTVDGQEGIANYIGGEGSIVNGNDNSNNPE